MPVKNELFIVLPIQPAGLVIKLFEVSMKRLSWVTAVFGLAFIIQGCAVYPYPYGHSVAYYGYSPYYGYNYGYPSYGYRPYSYYGYGLPYGSFGWGGGHWGGGHYWGGGYGGGGHHGMGFGWGGHPGWGGGGHGWGGGHGHH